MKRSLEANIDNTSDEIIATTVSLPTTNASTDEKVVGTNIVNIFREVSGEYLSIVFDSKSGLNVRSGSTLIYSGVWDKSSLEHTQLVRLLIIPTKSGSESHSSICIQQRTDSPVKLEARVLNPQPQPKIKLQPQRSTQSQISQFQRQLQSQVPLRFPQPQPQPQPQVPLRFPQPQLAQQLRSQPQSQQQLEQQIQLHRQLQSQVPLRLPQPQLAQQLRSQPQSQQQLQSQAPQPPVKELIKQ